MPRRLLLSLILLVAAPIVLLGWVSANMVRSNQIAARENLSTLLSTQLYDTDRQIVLMFERYAATLGTEIETSPSLIPTLKRLRRDNPIVRQGIFVDSSGLILFPRPADSPDIDAVEVAATLPAMVDARPLPKSFPENAPTSFADRSRLNPSDQQIDAGDYANSPESAKSGLQQMIDASVQGSARSQAAEPVQQFNQDRPAFLELASWQQWFMGDGAQVVLWRFREDGSSVGILFERSRWLADLIALLPDEAIGVTPPLTRRSITESTLSNLKNSKQVVYTPTPLGSITLVDESKREVYRWGKSEAGPVPLATVEISQPLASWQLRLAVDRPLLAEDVTIPLYLSLGGVAVLLLSLGGYVMTSVRRQIANAKSRVSFAGQVSHELRTPLTNIRLYTELAERDLGKLENCDAKDSLNNRLGVIDHESRRLQRLVSGVLEMIRPTGKNVGVRCEPTDLCELVSVIGKQFQPSFDAAEISLSTQCTCESALDIDPDVIELVLVNLLSNVEKYVSSGGKCRVVCQNCNDESSDVSILRILVEDDGPGIRKIHRSKIFRPFERLDDSISAPSGTGIGLTIARRAARRHGGDLKLLLDSEWGGAAFEITIPIGRGS